MCSLKALIWKLWKVKGIQPAPSPPSSSRPTVRSVAQSNSRETEGTATGVQRKAELITLFNFPRIWHTGLSLHQHGSMFEAPLCSSSNQSAVADHTFAQYLTLLYSDLNARFMAFKSEYIKVMVSDFMTQYL